MINILNIILLMVNKVIKCLEDCRQTKFVSINEYTPPIYRTKLNKCIQSILYNPKKKHISNSYFLRASIFN